MKDLELLPPFASYSDPEDEGMFLALALARGVYTSSPQYSVEAYSILNFSPSERFTRFSFSSYAPADRRALSYSRGVEELDTLDFALLRAWHRDGVPVFAWHLYPAVSVDWDALDIPAALQDAYGPSRLSEIRTLYQEARGRLCQILYQVRMERWAHQQFQSPPLFRALDEPPFNPLESSPENEEVMMNMAPAKK